MKFKKKSETVVATVVYDKSINNLKNLSNSLHCQSDKDFDLLILNDGVDNIYNYINNNLNIKIINTKGSISRIRIRMINQCKKMNYKSIIFIDSDDYLDEERVYITKKYLKKNSIVVNDIHLIDKKKKIIKKNFFSKRLKNKLKISNLDILEKNFLGLTNTAMKTSIIKNINLNHLTTAPIFDWSFWYMMLQKNKAIFTNETSTYYYNSYASSTSLLNNSDKSIQLKKEIKNRQIIYLKKNFEYPILKKVNYNHKFKIVSKHLFWWEVRGKISA